MPNKVKNNLKYVLIGIIISSLISCENDAKKISYDQKESKYDTINRPENGELKF